MDSLGEEDVGSEPHLNNNHDDTPSEQDNSSKTGNYTHSEPGPERSNPKRAGKPFGKPKRSQSAGSLHTSRKRRRLISHKGDWLLRGLYNDEYRELLNADMEDFRSGTMNEYDEQSSTTPGSYVGVRYWSEAEKAAFFDAVARFGQDNLDQIALKVGVSVPEIRQYLQLLNDGLEQLKLSGFEDLLPSTEDIPGAIELSADCCKHLDQAARALALHQMNMEAKRELGLYGQFWLIDRKIAENCDKAIQSDSIKDDAEPPEHEQEHEINGAGPSDSVSTAQSDILHQIPSAKLLNAGRLLHLAETVFMNSSDPEANWRSYVGDNDGVTIFRSAFEELHKLAISLTRRIMYAAHFQAMSRLRAMRDPALRHRFVGVIKSDVESAVKLLGLQPDSHEFWASLPRRFGFTCLYQKDNRPGSKMYKVTTDIAEEHLRRPIDPASYFKKVESEFLTESQDITETVEESRQTDDDTLDTDAAPRIERSRNTRRLQRDREHDSSEFEPGSSSDSDDIDTTSHSHSSDGEVIASKKTPLRREVHATPELDSEDEKEEHYLEKLDREASKREERRLWAMLDITPLNGDDLVPNPVMQGVRTTRELETAATSWRESIDFRPEWCDRPPSFQQNRPVFRRRSQSATSNKPHCKSNGPPGSKRSRRTRSKSRESHLADNEMDGDSMSESQAST